jgi:CheY-like chemotaxis protein
MRRILFIYPDKLFLDFIKRYYAHKGLEIYTAADGASGFNIATNEHPDLIVCNRVLPHLDLKGFMIKKRITPSIKHIPVFLIGDFNPREIMDYRAQNVRAFVSFPLNPQALLERMFLFFDLKIPAKSTTTPMLVDIHAKGDIIIIQIESRLEEEKIELLNYQVRAYCQQQKIKKPLFLYIMPTLDDDSITDESLDVLFELFEYEELKIKPQQFKILSTNKKLIKMFQQHEIYSQFEFVENYYEGIQRLNVSFDMSKKVPVDFLKPACSYIFDLFDDSGAVRIPALTTVTEEMIVALKKSGERNLTYYSEKDISEIVNDDQASARVTSVTDAQSNVIMTEYQPLTLKGAAIELQNEKMTLFFHQLKGLSALIISNNKSDRAVIKSTLDQYMILDFSSTMDSILEILERKKYILVFIDEGLPNSMSLLQQIRSFASRRRISVIIMARSLNRDQLELYRKHGTDYILISPFSTSKLIYKVFHAISSDRKT